MALSFPSNPTIGQQYQASNGFTYTWNGTVWEASVGSGGSSGGGSSGGGAAIVFTNGTLVTQTATSLNFVGSVVTATNSGTAVTIDIVNPATPTSLGLVQIGLGLNVTQSGIISVANQYWQASSEIYNSTDSVNIYTPTGSSVNISTAIVPTGAGASLATTIGNERGQYATDWQKVLTNNIQVASGNYSVIGGGSLNAATNLHAVIVGGNKNLADGEYTTILGGQSGATRGITGATIIPGAATGGARGTPGTAQAGFYMFGAETYDSNLVTMTTDGTNSVSTSNQLILVDNSAYYIKGKIIAKAYQTYRGQVSSWTFEGAIRRDVGSTTTDFVPSAVAPVVNLTGNLSTSSNMIVNLNINNALGSLEINVAGLASTHIRWACLLETVEITDDI